MIFRFGFAWLFSALIFTSCEKEDTVETFLKPPAEFTADSLRMNEIQVIGSHNSYRRRTYQPIFDLLNSFTGATALDPSELDYDHLPLDEQFSDYGVRQIELDIYYDPAGGRFYERRGNQLVGEPVASGIAELNDPGMKLIHIADIDYQTNYISFKDALKAVKEWSEANSNHLPIFILIEVKETSLSGVIPIFTWTETLPFDAAAMEEVDKEIRDVFGNALEKVITPDDVRGEFATLEEAVTTRGWPFIAEARGKVVFLLDNEGQQKADYLQGHPSLQGRIMFTSSEPGNAEAAFVKENNAFSAKIEEWVEQGFIVRTRSDEGTKEARSGDVSKRERAFASGAQLISTDYYRADPRHSTSLNWTDYAVRFEGNAVARLNPVNGPEKFKGGEFE